MLIKLWKSEALLWKSQLLRAEFLGLHDFDHHALVASVRHAHVAAADEPRHPALQSTNGHAGVLAYGFVGERGAAKNQADAETFARLPVGEPAEEPHGPGHALEMGVGPEAGTGSSNELLTGHSTP